ncbi:hypothetical protein [Limobrevibacterium gyesilva]|nr:hypothetical protein [Limobrevibacterium gyesilva]
MQIASYRREPGRLPLCIAEKAYEVYSALHGDRQSLSRLGERGGFSAGEVIAFLYARQFPRPQWSDRVHEAFRGMVAS